MKTTDIVGNRNLRDTWDDLARTHGEKIGLICEEPGGGTREFTYARLNEEINRTANLFLELGIQKGEKVAIQLRNCPEFLLCWFGLAKIGAVTVPLNVQYTRAESDYILNQCGAAAIVLEEDFLPMYDGLIQGGRNGVRHILLARSERQVPGARNFAAQKDTQPAALQELRPLSCDDDAEILFTSGTTAHPKGVVLTHYNIIYAGIYTAWQCSLRAGDRYLTIMPAFHVDFQLNAMAPVFTVGATMIMIEKYSATRFWKQIVDYRATVTECIPMMMRTLMMQPRKEWERSHCLREVFFYLALADREKDAFVERFQVRLLTSYGSTETLVGVIGDYPFGERRWPSIGRPGFSYEAKIIDEDGNALGPRAIGEICVRGVPGRTIMKGYHDDPKATAEALNAEGWFHTGDRGYTDEAGWFYFVDRKENMIKRAGENISAAEIERILMRHPLIAEAAVVGVPDPIRDQAVKAFVVCKDDAVLSAAEILAYCKARMARFKVPASVELRQDLPRTCTYKVDKKRLR